MPFQHRLNNQRKSDNQRLERPGSDKVHVKEKPRILEIMILFTMCPLVGGMIFMTIIANNVNLNLLIIRKEHVKT